MLASQLCPTLQHHGLCSPSGFSVHGILRARMLEWVAMPSSRVFSPNPGIEPAFQADSLPSEPPGKPRGGSTWAEF